MRISISTLTRVAEDIRAVMGDDEDAQAFLDTLDGETDVMDIIGALIREREEARAVALAMKEIAATYAERRARLERRADACAASLGLILDAIGERKVAHPMGTVSRTVPRSRVVIETPEDIPTQLRKWQPDAAAVKKQLEAGEAVPGARLDMGEPGVMVRIA